MARYGQTIKLPVPAIVVVQFMLDYLAQSNHGRLVCELPPTLDAALTSSLLTILLI
jgi:hypothetical protein